MPGPRKKLTSLDKKMLHKAYDQGGIINFLGQQPEVTAPIRAQSHVDSPPTQLAYITDAEKDLLLKANIHGSLAGKPNNGPAGLESFDDWYTDSNSGQVGGGSTANTGYSGSGSNVTWGGGGGHTGGGNNSGSGGGYDEGAYLDDFVPGGENVTYAEMLKGTENTAYETALDRSEKMKEAMKTLYSGTDQTYTDEEKAQWMKENPGQSWTTTSWIDRAKSNFHYLTDDQKQAIIDSGLAAAESSGILGGTMGAEQVMNDLKKDLAQASSQEEFNEALSALNRYYGGYDSKLGHDMIGGQDVTNMLHNMGLLGHDQSAVYDWNTDIDKTGVTFDPKTGQWSNVKKNDYLKNAFYDMQSPNLTPRKYTSYMNNIGAFGHKTNRFGGYGGSGGYGGYGGGGGGGDSYGGGGGGRGMPQGNPNEAWGAMSPLQQAMINTNAAPGFSQGYKRGGIVSLVC